MAWGGEEGREGVANRGPPGSYATQQRVSMATLNVCSMEPGGPLPEGRVQCGGSAAPQGCLASLAASSVLRLL